MASRREHIIDEDDAANLRRQFAEREAQPAVELLRISCPSRLVSGRHRFRPTQDIQNGCCLWRQRRGEPAREPGNLCRAQHRHVTGSVWNGNEGHGPGRAALPIDARHSHPDEPIRREPDCVLIEIAALATRQRHLGISLERQTLDRLHKVHGRPLFLGARSAERRVRTATEHCDRHGAGSGCESRARRKWLANRELRRCRPHDLSESATVHTERRRGSCAAFGTRKAAKHGRPPNTDDR